MWELDCEESWAPKNWCFWTVVLEKTLESLMDWKEMQTVHSKGDQSWVFFGRNDAKAETPVLWPPHAKSWLIGKDSDAGRDWRQEEKGITEDEMVGWHHWLDRRGFGWTPGVGDGQGGLACCDSWGRKELDTTEQLNWTKLQPTNLLSLWESPDKNTGVGCLPFSRGSSPPRDWICISFIASRFFNLWAPGEAQSNYTLIKINLKNNFEFVFLQNLRPQAASLLFAQDPLHLPSFLFSN